MEKNFKKKEAKEKSGCSSMSKAYKFTVDLGYLHDIKGNYYFSIFYLFFTNYRRRKSEFKLLSINEKERATPHLGVSWKGCLPRELMGPCLEDVLA
ncbi:hypothetical protein pdam_00012201 [Pocillopora damicornis]|uniref:Uncharacterized protein n=1 Tax=Pocillopora damicornis TaxID=46731 RepID=A0A3M6UDX0_POCDA|nr:hypothetical protein pdam_00012201 [Pocillopora damicornis]